MAARYERLFKSFFLGGFECSTHRLASGKRLDEIAFTHHDRLAREDYLRLHDQGIRAARDGLRWHLIEANPGDYDFSSAAPMLRASLETRTQVVWDLFHYGWPDWLDIFAPKFIDAFSKYARQFARLWREETDDVLFACPVNEISFFSWGAGDGAVLNPFAHDRGNELKEQLVRANIAACEALWDVDIRTRIAQIDPMINVLPMDPKDPEQVNAAEAYRLSQFEAWDMLAGRLKPELGGAAKYLDIIGGNYYVHNQWILGAGFIDQDNPRYRPFREIIKELYARYQRPFFIAETGIEDELRPTWFRYVCTEARAALEASVELQGICLYPIVNHPGWLDDRHCYNGLWDYPNEGGEREIYQPLADELQHQRQLFQPLLGLKEKN
jgi:beta-glucosidase/6-phospho-beta-glucosidase/beta-galactosidase